MDDGWNRRRVLKQLTLVAGTLVLPARYLFARSSLAGVRRDWEIQISSISAHTLRLSMLPRGDSERSTIPVDGSLVQASWGAPVASLHGDWHAQSVKTDGLVVRYLARADLIAMAETVGRPKDLRRAAELRQSR